MASHLIQNNRQSKSSFLLLVLVVLVATLIVYVYFKENTNKLDQLTTSTTTLTIDVADSQSARERGLSGRESINKNSGMLFVFDNASLNNCFWMKDMNFAIDMVWLDDQKKVITVTQNVGPDTYPKVFCPDVPAKYGLEISAQSSDQYGIELGETLRF